MPNLIHRLDAEILMECVLKLKQKNIFVLTSYDCTSCIIFYAFDVRQAYFEVFYEVIIQNDSLKYFFEANINEKEDRSYIDKLLTQYNENKREFLVKLQNKSLVIDFKPKYLLNPKDLAFK